MLKQETQVDSGSFSIPMPSDIVDFSDIINNILETKAEFYKLVEVIYVIKVKLLPLLVVIYMELMNISSWLDHLIKKAEEGILLDSYMTSIVCHSKESIMTIVEFTDPKDVPWVKRNL